MATRTISAVGGNWSATTAWTEGAVPTAADDVVATALSGSLVVTNGAVCRSADFTNYTGTLSGSGSWSIGNSTGGSLKFVSGMTVTYSGLLTFVSTTTGNNITMAGKQISDTVFNGAGGGWTLQDAFANNGGVFNLTAGTLNTNNQSVTIGSLTSSNSNTRTLTLGSSAISCQGVECSTVTNLTISSNTATITIGLSSATFNMGNKNWNGTSLVANGTGTAQFNNAFTVANLTRSPSGVKTAVMTQNSSFTVTGTLTVGGDTAANRLLMGSTTIGTARTITVNGSIVAQNIDIQDITGAGSAPWNLSAITGGSGDCGGNSGITFTTLTTVYGVGSGVFDLAANWASSSGGSGGSGRIPLPQDTAIFDANTTGTRTVNTSGRYGTLTIQNTFTGTLALNAATWFGSFTLGTGVTLSGAGTQTFSGRGSYTITTNGQTVPFSVTVANVTGTLTLQDAFTSSRSATGALTVSSGTLDTNSQSVTLSGTSATVSHTAGTITAGTTTFTVGTTATATFWSCTGGTFSNPDSTIVLSAASSNTRTFAGNGKTYGTLTYTVAASSGVLAITGSNTFTTINVSGGSRTIRFTSGTTTTVTTFNVFGTAGNLVTIDSSSAGSAATLSKAGGGVVDTVNYVSVKDSTASPSSTWYAGGNSTNVSGNTNWIFSTYLSHSSGSLSLNGQTASVDFTSTTQSFSNGVMTLTGQDPTSTPSPVSLTPSQGLLTVGGQDGSVSPQPLSQSTTAGDLVLPGQTPTFTLSSLSQNLVEGSLLMGGQVASVNPSPYSLMPSSGDFLLVGRDGVVSPTGAVNALGQLGDLVLAGQSPLAEPGGVNIDATAGNLMVAGQTSVLYPVVVELFPSEGSLLLEGQSMSTHSNPASALAGEGALVLQGGSAYVVIRSTYVQRREYRLDRSRVYPLDSERAYSRDNSRSYQGV